MNDKNRAVLLTAASDILPTFALADEPPAAELRRRPTSHAKPEGCRTFRSIAM